jgi:histidyl-tRNA synthetase
MQAINKIKGFPDLFSPESDKYSFIEETAKEVFSRYGCRELRIPILEKTELFSRSIGGDTDIVQKEMYTFADRKNRSLTLRPEATAGVVRAYIENKIYNLESTSKLFTCGPMFRYERPQKGRQRQFHQVNLEILGPNAPQADAELLFMLWVFLRELGLSYLALQINSLGCPQCRPDFHEALRTYLQAVDQDSLCQDCLRRSVSNPLRVLDCKVEQCQTVLAEAPEMKEHLCSACREHFDVVLNLIEEAGLPYSINPKLVRGLDYYQRTTFEVVSSDIGAQTAVAGGGRYDGLVKELGGPDLPGLGFACGMERLVMLLKDKQRLKSDFYLAVLDPQGLNRALLLAQTLREKGIRGEVSYEAKSLKSQLRYANKQGAAYCLVLGEKELSSETVLVKNLETGEQKEIAQANLYQVFSL